MRAPLILAALNITMATHTLEYSVLLWKLPSSVQVFHAKEDRGEERKLSKRKPPQKKVGDKRTSTGKEYEY